MTPTHLETITERAAARRTSGYSSSRVSAVCCLESFSRLSARRSDRVRRSRSNRTAAATRGPASDPRPASSAPATQRQPSERSKRNSREVLERPDLLRGPVGPERLADDPVARDRPPESAVLARATVIAHHEVMIGWNGDLLREIARGSTSAGHDEVLLRALPVDDRVTVLDSQGVAGTGDDPLDEVRVGLFVGRLRARLARGLLHPAPV